MMTTETPPTNQPSQEDYEEWYRSRSHALRHQQVAKKSAKKGMRWQWTLILVSLAVIVFGFAMVKMLSEFSKRKVAMPAVTVPATGARSSDTIQITPKVLLEAKDTAKKSR